MTCSSWQKSQSIIANRTFWMFGFAIRSQTGYSRYFTCCSNTDLPGSQVILGFSQVISCAVCPRRHVQGRKILQMGIGDIPPILSAALAGGPPVPQEIIDVSNRFRRFAGSEARSGLQPFKRSRVRMPRRLVAQAGKAFADWKAVVAMPRHAEMCELFLAAPLLGERLKK